MRKQIMIHVKPEPRNNDYSVRLKNVTTIEPGPGLARLSLGAQPGCAHHGNPWPGPRVSSGILGHHYIAPKFATSYPGYIMSTLA